MHRKNNKLKQRQSALYTQQYGFSLLESMIALSCLLIVLNSMQTVHSQLSINLYEAQKSLNQQWSFEDLTQRFKIFTPYLKKYLADKQQLTNLNLAQFMAQCSDNCEALEALLKQVDEWTLKSKDSDYFINQQLSWTLFNKDPNLLFKLEINDTKKNLVNSFSAEI